MHITAILLSSIDQDKYLGQMMTNIYMYVTISFVILKFTCKFNCNFVTLIFYLVLVVTFCKAKDIKISHRRTFISDIKSMLRVIFLTKRTFT